MSAFDLYHDNYQETVEESIAFSGLRHDIFLTAKVKVLEELFSEHFGSTRPSLIDVGCGVGALHPHLRPIVGKLAGTDPSIASIERATHDNPDILYRVDDTSALPWSDASFDVALAVCVFHHVAITARARLIAEMRRVVRNEGLVVIVEHNPLNPLTQLAVARCPFDDDAILLTAQETKSLLRGCGCSHIESRHFLVFPWRSSLARSIERAVERMPIGAQYVTAGQAD